MSASVREFLIHQIHLKQKDFNKIQVGQSVAKALPTEEREEIAVFGIIRMQISPEYFLSRFRNIIRFEAGKGILQSGMFSSPPQFSDVANLKWEHDDIQEISRCKSDDCSIRLPTGSWSGIQSQIDWSANDASIQVNELLRQRVIDFMNSYQHHGDDALPVYRNDGNSIVVKDGFRLLLKNFRFLQLYFPKLVSYLQNFPNEKNPNVEDLFYWQKVEFGLQPVIRLSHVVILKQDGIQPCYAIASKMLYANHYFRDGLEARLLIPDSETNNNSAFYLVVLNRSHVDGMTGFKGWFIRRRVVNESVDKLNEWLRNKKVHLEKDFQKIKDH